MSVLDHLTHPIHTRRIPVQVTRNVIVQNKQVGHAHALYPAKVFAASQAAVMKQHTDVYVKNDQAAKAAKEVDAPSFLVEGGVRSAYGGSKSSMRAHPNRFVSPGISTFDIRR